jgi:hypoxanthine phosphoribosyltransferase
MQEPFRVIFDAQKIHERVAELARQIAEEYGNRPLMIIGLLNGCFIFLADLVRQLNSHHLSLVIDFMRVSSYGSETVTSGKPTLMQDIKIDVKNRHILVVDDILDSGHTLHFVIRYLNAMDPRSLKTCVCLDKPSRRQLNIQADYVGFTVPDEYVVGYGLDYEGRFRECPDISIFSSGQGVAHF